MRSIRHNIPATADDKCFKAHSANRTARCTKVSLTRYLPYWCCYQHQGMVTALVLYGVTGYFRYAGLDLSQLSWLSLSMLPWVTKFLWAPWNEHRTLLSSHYPYLDSLMIVQLLMALLMMGISWLSPTQSIHIILFSLILLTLLSASHDIYADGITICSTNSHTRPFANAAQVGGSYLGIFLGSSIFLAVVQHTNWQGGFLAMAALSLLLLIPIKNISIAPHRARTDDRPCLSLSNITTLWPTLAFTAIYYLAMRGMMALQTVILIDQKLSLVALGQAITFYSTLISGLGIVLGSWLIKRLGSLRCLLPVMMSHTLLAIMLAIGYSFYTQMIWVGIFGLVNLIAAIGFVTLYNVLMELVRPHQPASDYALFQSVDAVVAMTISIIALRLAHHTGYQSTLIVLATLAIISLWPACRLHSRLAKIMSLSTIGDR